MRIVLNGETGRMQEFGTGQIVPTLQEIHGVPLPEVESDRPALRLVGQPARFDFAPAPPAAAPPPAPIRPRDVIRLAKARAAEIRAELRRMRSLQSELAQLQALLAAAASAARPPMTKPDQGTDK